MWWGQKSCQVVTHWNAPLNNSSTTDCTTLTQYAAATSQKRHIPQNVTGQHAALCLKVIRVNREVQTNIV